VAENCTSCPDAYYTMGTEQEPRRCQYIGDFKNPGASKIIDEFVTGIHCGEDSGLGSAWEANLRMPGLVRWPGKVKAGVESWDSVSTLDVLPTALKFVGVEKLPEDLDGMDVSELWLNDPEDCSSSKACKAQKTQLDQRVLFFWRDGFFKNSTVPGEPPNTLPFPYGRFDVVAAKLGPIKAWIYTKSAYLANSDEEVYHDPPLLFDVVADPAEATPLDPKKYKDVAKKIMDAVKLHKATVTRVASQTLAEGDEFFPCVNKKKSCRTWSHPSGEKDDLFQV
jgi:arylsulfatase A-like enzyme